MKERLSLKIDTIVVVDLSHNRGSESPTNLIRRFRSGAPLSHADPSSHLLTPAVSYFLLHLLVRFLRVPARSNSNPNLLIRDAASAFTWGSLIRKARQPTTRSGPRRCADRISLAS